jgi:hypothetical protein
VGPRPLLHGLLVVVLLAYVVVALATQTAGTSPLSHLGGFVCGLFPAFLFMPRLKNER